MGAAPKSEFMADFDIHQRIKDLARSRPRIKGITIDRPGTNIMDDGISIEREKPNDGWTVRVSVVDLPAIIPDGHSMERRARLMGHEHRTRHGLERLFPYDFLRNHVSFSTEAPRPAITFKVKLDDTLVIQEACVYRSMFQSKGKFSTCDINDEIQNGNSAMSEWSHLAERLHEKRLNTLAALGDAIFVDSKAPTFPDYYETVIKSLNPGNTIVHEMTTLARKVATDFLAAGRMTPSYQENSNARVDVLLASHNQALEERCNAAIERITEELSYRSPPYIRMSSPMRIHDAYLNLKMIGSILNCMKTGESAGGVTPIFQNCAGQKYNLLPFHSPAGGQKIPQQHDPDSMAGVLFDMCGRNGLAMPDVSERSLMIDNQCLYLAGLSMPGQEDHAVFAVVNHRAVALETASFRMIHALSLAHPGKIMMPSLADENTEPRFQLDPV